MLAKLLIFDNLDALRHRMAKVKTSPYLLAVALGLAATAASAQ
ncbi:hypothetical protein [Kosakonia sp. H7A]|nr:hypothetical protein [Kosakonia sp. H7A]